MKLTVAVVSCVLGAANVSAFTPSTPLRTSLVADSGFHTSTRSSQQTNARFMHMKLSSNSNEKRNRFNILRPFTQSSKSTSISSTASMDVNYNNNNNPSPKKMLLSFLTKLQNLNEVTKWRIAASTFISSLLLFSPVIDQQLIHFWSYIQTGSGLFPRMFRHDHWEWMLAVSAFFVWIHGFWFCDRLVAKADAVDGGRNPHPFKRHRLQDQYAIEKRRRMLQKQLDAGQIDATEFQTRTEEPVKITHAKWHLGAWLFELPLYCIPLYIWDITIPRRAAKIAAWGAPTTLQIMKDITSALLLYDLGFFFCHYTMHKIPFLYKFVHAKHHKSTEVRAADQVRLSFGEEIVDVGISILALNYLKVHPIARSIYNVIITFLLTELHSGFAFPWTPQFVLPFGLSTGSKGHHYHHRNGEKYYQKFFCTVDRLFGFVQKKDDSLKGFSVSTKVD